MEPARAFRRSGPPFAPMEMSSGAPAVACRQHAHTGSDFLEAALACLNGVQFERTCSEYTGNMWRSLTGEGVNRPSPPRRCAPQPSILQTGRAHAMSRVFWLPRATRLTAATRTVKVRDQMARDEGCMVMRAIVRGANDDLSRSSA